MAKNNLNEFVVCDEKEENHEILQKEKQEIVQLHALDDRMNEQILHENQLIRRNQTVDGLDEDLASEILEWADYY